MTYEYECNVCSHTFEAEQKISDEPLIECPKCKTCSIQRLISGGTGFVLKGVGWESDGYSSSKDDDK